jgi:PAS domain S-box-containing protein
LDSSRSDESEARPPETTVEELLVLIDRLVARQPHAQCRTVGGPLGPLAVALNHLSNQLSSGHTKTEDAFGIRALAEQSPNIMVTCDTEARIRYINFSVPGISPTEGLGTSYFDWVPPESQEEVRTVIHRVLTTGEPGTYENRTTVSTGAEWNSVKVGPIKSEGRIVGFAAIATDITHLKKTQQRLEQSNRELESFAYVASHDLQEPLRKIQTFGERLKTTCAAALSPEGRDYVDRMQAAATRMRRLIDDLLSFSRVSSHAQPFTQVDLRTVAHEVLVDLETAIEKAGASVTVGELPLLAGDPMQMRQLLQNLLSNALKFRREGVPPSISVRGMLEAKTQRCVLEVEDNGIGFEEKYAERIFNVFQRLHGRGQYEGTGIGLAICRKIVERHGGTITARSTPGVGTVFRVSLPLNQHTPR